MEPVLVFGTSTKQSVTNPTPQPLPTVALQGESERQLVDQPTDVAGGVVDLTKPVDQAPPNKAYPTFSELMPEGVNWYVAGWIIFLHVGALTAPYFFTWQGLLVAIALGWLSAGVGICLGFHRLLTHKSFATHALIRYALALIGGLAGEGPVLTWVANHRKHHSLSDQPGDPHTPNDGPWWSHMFWFAKRWNRDEWDQHLKRWAPDLQNDRGLHAIGKLFLPAHFALGLTLLIAGWLWGGWFLGCSLLSWGLFARLVYVLHTTWLVNSASHMWGYANYKTRDNSRNNWWVAVLTYGEGWHNNHHAHPRMANHGHRWWEFDITYRTIRLMQFLGLVWDVVDYRNNREKRADAEHTTEAGEPAEGELDDVRKKRCA